MESYKVLYIGGFELPDKNAAAQRVIANSKILRDLGCKVVLAGLSKNPSDLNSPFTYQGFECINLKYPAGLKEWFTHICCIRENITLIEKFNPNLIIAYNYPAVALKRLLRYAKINNIKIIGDCTEWYQPQGSCFFRIIKGLDVFYRMRYVHTQLDGIIVISEYLLKYYQNHSCKVLLLPPLVDKQDIKWELARKKASKSIDTNNVKLLYAGSPGLGNKDRLDLIIQVLQKIDQNNSIPLEFNVIGISEQDYKKNYNIENSSIIPSFVHFIGRISHEEVLTYLQMSHFQIFVRENNLANTAGFPTKFVESISSKVLVLTNYSSDLHKYLIDGQNGFVVDISTVEQFYKTLLYALDKSTDELSVMQSHIDSEIFDYRNYLLAMKDFLTKINIVC
ncbi:glycosyltransferase [Mediterranea massiliensis]|uniref:glycosyltransferase n=1 Tax=Mediterranea massiliensis TaxID=1841865 RepID=UPI0025A474DB|nr:glycosyltransferase [Mediterranea massiliensis]MDM8337657.1 glycosyltransferase [Mediterranea massiliensis]